MPDDPRAKFDLPLAAAKCYPANRAKLVPRDDSCVVPMHAGELRSAIYAMRGSRLRSRKLLCGYCHHLVFSVTTVTALVRPELIGRVNLSEEEARQKHKIALHRRKSICH
jgi:hypothetical protein